MKMHLVGIPISTQIKIFRRNRDQQIPYHSPLKTIKQKHFNTLPDLIEPTILTFPNQQINVEPYSPAPSPPGVAK
jgi:hypothetical protein